MTFPLTTCCDDKEQNIFQKTKNFILWCEKFIREKNQWDLTYTWETVFLMVCVVRGFGDCMRGTCLEVFEVKTFAA